MSWSQMFPFARSRGAVISADIAVVFVLLVSWMPSGCGFSPPVVAMKKPVRTVFVRARQCIVKEGIGEGIEERVIPCPLEQVAVRDDGACFFEPELTCRPSEETCRPRWPEEVRCPDEYRVKAGQPQSIIRRNDGNCVRRVHDASEETPLTCPAALTAAPPGPAEIVRRADGRCDLITHPVTCPPGDPLCAEIVPERRAKLPCPPELR